MGWDGRYPALGDDALVDPLEPREIRAVPVAGRTLAGQVAAFLRDLIARQNLRPGDRLPGEGAVSDSLGISRPIVREGFKALSATGLLAMAAGRRAVIRPLSGDVFQAIIEDAVITGQADIWDVMEMRRGIESAMVGLAARRRDARQVARLEDLVRTMAARTGDVRDYAALDMRLHLTLAEAADNPLYRLLVESCARIFETSRVMGLERWSEGPDLAGVQRLHEDIVAAVAAGDAGRASEAMIRHFDNALAVMFGGRPRRRRSSAPVEG